MPPNTRVPEKTLANRLDPLPVLPVFLKLDGRRAALAGNGEALAWKAELLSAAGARVFIFSPTPSETLLAQVARSGGALELVRRSWSEADLGGAAVAVLEPEGDEAAILRFTRAARAAGALVNVIDLPAFCEFQFGTIVNRAPVVIGISTDGAAPILGQALRRRIEALLPRRLGDWAQAAKGYRARLVARMPEKADRRRFWEGFVDASLGRAGSEACPPDALEALADAALSGATQRRGEISVIGSGPGDPELLTLKGMRALQGADVILHERLASPAMLELGRREAERIAFDGANEADLVERLVELIGQDLRIALLVTDAAEPALARLLQPYRAADVPVISVPGVTVAA